MKYRALTGLNFKETRVEPGEITDAVPERSVKWLLAQGHIEALGEEEPKKKSTKGNRKRDLPAAEPIGQPPDAAEEPVEEAEE